MLGDGDLLKSAAILQIKLMTPTVLQASQVDDVLDRLKPGSMALHTVECEQWYLPGRPKLFLLVVLWSDPGHVAQPQLLVTEKFEQTDLDLLEGGHRSGLMRALSSSWQVPIVDLSQPLPLKPINITKPWGQEIWYTGIEERGLSGVTDGVHSIPLAWLVGIIPRHLLGLTGHQPNLLKILDPLPEPVYGDLYFELHQQKREVYVVTRIDTQAWPNGVGALRYGFCQTKRQSYGNDDKFKAAYLKAVSRYRNVRRQLDLLIDEIRLREGIALNEPLPANVAKAWRHQLPTALVTQEQLLRETMDSYTHMQPLREGDVVKVPLFMPHALQHGVRTVEFQSPVYERKILSFAQKVLTQGHWDTEEAMAMADLEPVADPITEVLLDDDKVKMERIVSFEDFEVERCTMQGGSDYQLPLCDTYVLAMVVRGVVEINRFRLGAEQAVMLPAKKSAHLRNGRGGSTTVLLTRPRV